MTASRASAPPAGVASASAVSRRVAVGLAAAGLAIVFSSGLTTSAWSSFPDPALGGDLLVFALLGAAFFPATTPPAALCAATLVAVQAALLASFLGTTEGKLLFTDDHSTFFYRLHILAARFPDLTYYDPGWNAGRLTTEVFPTGAILLYLVAAPFLAVWPLETAYNAVVGVTLFGVCPLLVVAAASLLGFDRRSRWVAGLLSLMPSLMVARWALKYGAVPFVLVSYASMLVYALARRLAIADRGAWPIGVGLALLLSAALLWSGAVFLLAPVGAAAFLDPRATGRGRLRLIALVVIVAAANAWWMLEYVRHVPVFDFVSKADALNEAPLVTKGEIGFGRSLEATWAILQKTSPILLALAPLALLERERRPIVLRLLGLALVFLVIAVLGPQVKRHLELDRMALAMALCLALTGSSALRVLWRAGTAGGLEAPVARGLVVAMLLVTVFGARIFTRNESVERFGTIGPEVESLVERIRAETSGGRTYFAGFVLHEFSGGHAAALQPLAGVEMAAIEPSHRFWHYRNPIPPQFRGRPDGVRRYLELLNVDLVVTKDREWRRRLEGDDAFEPLWSEGRFALFRFREAPGSWFHEGRGVLETAPNLLRVRLEDDRAVLRYRWVDGLRASGTATVEPVEIEGIRWIGVRGRAGETTEVGYP